MSCETSSVWIKIAIFVLGLICVIYIVGFATTSWATWDVSASVSTETETYSLGLWQECSCVETPLTEKYCLCVKQMLSLSKDTEWFTVVQIVEAIGLVGLIFCEIITFLSICIQPNPNLKILILILLPFSCMCIIIGLIVFGIEKDKVYGVSGKISYSFILCATAAGLGLLCLPLFILDMRSKPAASSQTTVDYSDEGYIIQPSPSDASMSNQYPTPGNMKYDLNMAYQQPSYGYTRF